MANIYHWGLFKTLLEKKAALIQRAGPEKLQAASSVTNRIVGELVSDLDELNDGSKKLVEINISLEKARARILELKRSGYVAIQSAREVQEKVTSLNHDFQRFEKKVESSAERVANNLNKLIEQVGNINNDIAWIMDDERKSIVELGVLLYRFRKTVKSERARTELKGVIEKLNSNKRELIAASEGGVKNLVAEMQRMANMISVTAITKSLGRYGHQLRYSIKRIHKDADRAYSPEGVMIRLGQRLEKLEKAREGAPIEDARKIELEMVALIKEVETAESTVIDSIKDALKNSMWITDIGWGFVKEAYNKIREIYDKINSAPIRTAMQNLGVVFEDIDAKLRDDVNKSAGVLTLETRKIRKSQGAELAATGSEDSKPRRI